MCDLQLRKQLDLHVNLVHGFSMSGLPTRHKDVDIVVIRSALPPLYRHALRRAQLHLGRAVPHQTHQCFMPSEVHKSCTPFNSGA